MVCTLPAPVPAADTVPIAQQIKQTLYSVGLIKPTPLYRVGFHTHIRYYSHILWLWLRSVTPTATAPALRNSNPNPNPNPSFEASLV